MLARCCLQRYCALYRGFIPAMRSATRAVTGGSVPSSTVSSADMQNPFCDWYSVPDFSALRADQIVPAVKKAIQEASAAIEALERRDVTSWSDFMPDFDAARDKLERTVTLQEHLAAVTSTPEIREAVKAVQSDIVQFSARIEQSLPLFQRVARLAARNDLSSAQRRVVELYMREARLRGVDLDPALRQRFNALETQLAQYSKLFSEHVLDDTAAFKLTITSRAGIEGLPANVRAVAAALARQHGHAQATADDGPWVVTLDHGSYAPFLQHSVRRDLREQVYRASVAVGSGHGPAGAAMDNRALVADMIRLRDEQARLLGRASWAHLSTEKKMAGRPEAAWALLDRIRPYAERAAAREHAELVELARSRGAPEATSLQPWDIPFWAERLRESRYSITDEAVAPYFPLPQVLRGLFALAERLFGMRVERLEGSDRPSVWHPDVLCFAVHDAASAGSQPNSNPNPNPNPNPRALFYLDPVFRPGKRAGAWMNPLVGVAPEHGPGRLPVAVLVCNFAPGADAQTPPLLTFRDVETMFHEFGHALQHMLTTVPYPAVAGIAGIEWDAVELPSQFMENWCTEPATLSQLGRHYRTQEPLPTDIADRLRAAKTFRAGSATMRQLYLAAADLAAHGPSVAARLRAGDAMAPHAEQQRLAQSLVPALLPDDLQLCRFSHLFAGGYAAGYYSYKWAECLSADAFDAFRQAGFGTPAVASLGQRFRGTVLALGGSAPALDVYRAFRGRDATPDALLRLTGLLP